MRIKAAWLINALAATIAGLHAPLARAQDSVATTPGNSDALSPYDHAVLVRYAVDLTPFSSSWGNLFLVGPILKASADPDPMFSTLILGAVAASPDHLLNLSFASTDFETWNSPGQGVNPDENSATSIVSRSGFDRQFGVAFNDLSSGPNNVIGAMVGQVSAEPSRLYVSRWLAMASRALVGDSDSATLSLGAIDADGNTLLRADGFNADPLLAVVGDNIIRVDLTQRSLGVNVASRVANSNVASDAGSSAFVIDESGVTTNTPATLPESLGLSPTALTLDFASTFRSEGGPATSSHLDSSVLAHRGNPSFSTRNELGGVGTVASLAKTTLNGATDSINLFAVDSSGTLVATSSATLPSPISDGAISRNVGGQSQFLHYLSQTSFRGGNGQVAVGFDPVSGSLLAAATATDPTEGDYIAVALLPNGQQPQWTIAAYEGKPVLDGLAGASLGTIAAASPASMSSPAADHWGNIYFVASFQPTVGPAANALIKAVNLVGGYELELVMKEGDAFAGANSSRTYTIDQLTLADSDSVASGSVFSGNVLAQPMPGSTPGGADDPTGFGGIMVNARITYDNSGTPEDYQAVLFVGPDLAPDTPCEGDADGSGNVDFNDINAVLGNWLNDYTPDTGPGDANFDSVVNFEDVNSILGNWLDVCP